MSKKMVDRNPHTGEALQSKANSDKYRDNWKRIFESGKNVCHCGLKDFEWLDCETPGCKKRKTAEALGE